MPSIGEFLCRHRDDELVEHTDEVKPGDKDARQEAAIRAWIALTNHNLPTKGADGTLAAAFDDADEQFHYPSIALSWAYADARRRLHGRASTGSKAMRTERLEGRVIREEWFHTEAEMFASSASSAAMIDHTIEAAYEAVEANIADELRKITEISDDHADAVSLMLVIQQVKALDQPIPQTLHNALNRMRKKTGLALNIKYL